MDWSGSFLWQAELLDAAAGVFMRFRLGGVSLWNHWAAVTPWWRRRTCWYLVLRSTSLPTFTTRSSPTGPSLMCVPAAPGTTRSWAWSSLWPGRPTPAGLWCRRTGQGGTGEWSTTAGDCSAARWRTCSCSCKYVRVSVVLSEMSLCFWFFLFVTGGSHHWAQRDWSKQKDGLSLLQAAKAAGCGQVEEEEEDWVAEPDVSSSANVS